MACHWWNRGHHRALRLADRRFMLPLLIGAPDKTNIQRMATVIAFMEARGQEHWCCPCGQDDAAEVLTAAIFPEEPAGHAHDKGRS